MSNKSLYTLMLLSWSFSLKAQQLETPNLSSSYLEESYPLFNPASIHQDTKSGNIFFSHKQGLGIFSVFNQNYFNGNYRFGADSVKRHGIGIRVINDRAGKYISANRIAFLYSYSIVISTGKKLNLGVAPTLINYQKQAQNYGGSNSAGNFDLGLWYSSHNLMVGLSFNQIIKNTLTAIEEQSIIRSQYIMNAKYTHRLHPNVSLQYQTLYNFNTEVDDEGMSGATINYKKHYRLSTNYEYDGNLIVLLGLYDFKVPRIPGTISLDLMSGIAVNHDIYKPRNSIEILLNYEF